MSRYRQTRLDSPLAALNGLLNKALDQGRHAFAIGGNHVGAFSKDAPMQIVDLAIADLVRRL